MHRHNRHLIEFTLVATVATLAAAIALTAGCGSERDLRLRPASPRAHDDLQEMVDRVRASQRQTIQVNLADELAYRFVQDRLDAVDKTRDSAPGLYALLDDLRDAHQLAQDEDEVSLDDLAVPGDHFISDFIGSTGSGQYEAGAFATTEDGSDYSYVDVVVRGSDLIGLSGSWDAATGGGKELIARTVGSVNELTGRTFIDSLHVVVRRPLVMVSYTALSNAVPILFETDRDALPTLNAISAELTEPSDRDGDCVISICLDRDSGDCDVTTVDRPDVAFPLAGTMAFPGNIESIQTGKDKTYVRLSSTRDGGTTPNCEGNPQGMCGFADRVGITTDGDQVAWDIDQADFGGQIPDASPGEWNMFLKVTAQPASGGVPMVGVISTLPASDSALQVPPLQVLRD